MAGFGFGKSKSKSQSTSESASNSESGNLAYDYLMSQFSPVAENAGGATNAISQLLLGGPGQDQGFQNFRDNSGYQFMLDEGNRNVIGNRAAGGLLNSGSTARKLQEVGQNTASASLGQYLSQLMGLSQLGLGYGGLLSDAGKYSNYESTSASQSTGKSSSFNVAAGGK